MKLSEYSQRSQQISGSFARTAVRRLVPFARKRLTDSEWLALMIAITELIQPAREESSRIARDFFDAERERQLPAEPRHDVLLQTYYEPAWLAVQAVKYREALAGGAGPDEDSLRLAQERKASSNAAAQIARVAAREVDNGGRKTMQEAVSTDPRCLGYARVEVGGSSCAFCTILISRGAVYKTEESAGELDVYHLNDDCRVVPVFDRSDWPGREAYEEANRLYREAARQPGDTVNNLRRTLRDNR